MGMLAGMASGGGFVPVPIPESGLQYYWPITEGAGTTLFDYKQSADLFFAVAPDPEPTWDDSVAISTPDGSYAENAVSQTYASNYTLKYAMLVNNPWDTGPLSSIYPFLRLYDGSHVLICRLTWDTQTPGSIRWSVSGTAVSAPAVPHTGGWIPIVCTISRTSLGGSKITRGIYVGNSSNGATQLVAQAGANVASLSIGPGLGSVGAGSAIAAVASWNTQLGSAPSNDEIFAWLKSEARIRGFLPYPPLS